MSVAEVARENDDRLIAKVADTPVWVWGLIAFALMAWRSLSAQWGGLPDLLGDTDDATRLTAVRELLAGASWFDTFMPRLGGEGGLPSHWSRLIDGPLAGLIAFLGLFTSAAKAELFTRAVWPLSLCAVLLALLAWTTWKRFGRLAAVLALAFAATTPVAMVQFNVGRIDHHNVQILGAVGALFVLGASAWVPRAGLIAGLLAGLSVAVGYEGLIFVAIGGVGVALWSVADKAMIPTANSFAVILVTTLMFAFVATVPPARWLDVHCDALSLNLIVLAAAGVLGLLIANTVLSDQHPMVRLAVAAGFGTLGAGLFGLLEPACLAGPFGQVPQAVRPIWLDNVMETYSLWRYFTQAPKAALAVALFLAIGTAAAIRVWWQNRSAANLFTLGVTLLGAACAAWQIKYLPYVTWLVLPSLATAVAGFDGTRSISPLAGRLVGLLLFNQYTAIIVGGLTLSLTGASASDKLADVLKQRRDCYRMSNIAALRDLPEGRIVSDTTMGPFVIAGSGHSALSAPYHRIPEAILAGHTIFAGSADEARRGLAASGIDYVLVCSTYQDPLVSAGGTNLASLLARGSAPGYLEAISLPVGNPLRLWRVQRH